MHYCSHCGRKVLVKHPKLGLTDSSDEDDDDGDEESGSSDSVGSDDLSD